MIKRIMRTLILGWILFWSLIGTVECASNYYVYNYIYPNSYIATIDTPTYTNKASKEVLVDFSKLGDNKLIFFNKDKNHWRPIYITEIKDIKYKAYPLRPDLITIGLAQVGLTDCKISLKTGLEYDIFKTTLLHEVLHCFGYKHVYNNPHDLMYPISNTVPNSNIKWYAKDLEKRM